MQGVESHSSKRSRADKSSYWKARMQHFAINYWALATVVKILTGMVWYSPLLFGKQWMKLVNCTPDETKARMPKRCLLILRPPSLWPSFWFTQFTTRAQTPLPWEPRWDSSTGWDSYS